MLQYQYDEICQCFYCFVVTLNHKTMHQTSNVVSFFLPVLSRPIEFFSKPNNHQYIIAYLCHVILVSQLKRLYKIWRTDRVERTQRVWYDEEWASTVKHFRYSINEKEDSGCQKTFQLLTLENYSNPLTSDIM